MFDNLHSFTNGPDETISYLKLPDQGLTCYVTFNTRVPSDLSGPLRVRVLSRVFAIDPRRMHGADHTRWAISMRYDVVRAEQHLPFRVETRTGG